MAFHASAAWWLPSLVGPFRDPAYFVRRDRLLERMSSKAPGDRVRPPLVVTLGTSRMLNGLNGAVAEERCRQTLNAPVHVANFGCPGGNLAYQAIVLGRLLGDGIEPDLVLVEVLPKDLSRKQFADLLHSQRRAALASDRHWLSSINLSDLLPPDGATGVAVWDYRKEIIRAVCPKLVPDGSFAPEIPDADPHGGYNLDETMLAGPEFRESAVRLAKKQYRDTVRQLEVQSPPLDCLRRMLMACRERGIATAVVIMPEGPEFRSWYGRGVRDAIVARLSSVAEETGASLIDTWQWIDDERQFRAALPAEAQPRSAAD